MIDNALVIVADFKLHALGVNPAQTLSDVSSALSQCLSATSGKFEEIASSFGSMFDSASEFLAGIAQSEKIQLSLNARIDFEVRLDLSVETVQLTSSINELNASFIALISDSYGVSIQDFNIDVTPSLQLRLQTENTATPFDLLQNPSALRELSFGGDFMGLVVVSIPKVPAEISLRALSQDITKASSLEFDLSLDIDLVPIKDSEYDHPYVNLFNQFLVRILTGFRFYQKSLWS